MTGCNSLESIPAFDGAIAFLTGSGAQVLDTPTATLKQGRKKRRVFLVREMAQLFQAQGIGNFGQMFCALESVHSMPKQGSTSSFHFGEGYGMWQGILATLGIPYELVTPQAWKKEMMPGMMKDKDASRVRAMQLYPQLSEQLKLKKHDGRAEALLIATHALRTHHRGARE